MRGGVDAGSGTFTQRTQLARHAARQFFEEDNKLGDQLKNVTLLIADVTNSTGLIEGLSPEEAMRLLQPTLKMMTDTVHDHGGFVSKLQGDGLMALFGAPTALEDHALRACRAALGIQNAASDPRSIHIGLNSGLVLLRAVSTDFFTEYEPVGWTVHLAARMCEMAGPGEIRLTGTTAEQIEGFSELDHMGATRIRGVQRQVPTFLLKSLHGDRTRWSARQALGLSRFVGRSDEIAALRRSRDRAAAGHGELVTLRGEAGIGKSRLIYELCSTPGPKGVQQLYCAAQSEGSGVAYWGIRSLLLSWLGNRADRGDGRSAALDAALAALTDDAPQIERMLRALRTLLDIPVTDAAWDRLDAFERRARLRDALREWVGLLARKSPLVIIFEDLHWLDPESDAILQDLATALPRWPVLLLTSCRIEYRWAGPSPDREIALDRLPDSSALLLLDGMMGTDPALQPLKARLLERAGGTPLFLEELVRSLVETGELVGETGAYRPAESAHSVEIPSNITAIVSARIDHQPPDARAVLELVAVSGRLPQSLLLRATELDEDRAVAALRTLVEARLLHRYPDGGEIGFRHDIVRETTYSLLLEPRRLALHCHMAKAIEALYAANLDEHVDQLAQHYLQGQEWVLAARYHFRTCLRALARSANRQVVSFAHAGVAALENVPATPDLTKLAVDLRLIANNALITTGDLDAIVENVADAERLTQVLDDPRRAASVKTHLAIARWLQGEPDAARAVASEALDIARDIAHPALQMGACSALGMAFHAVGRYREATQLHEGLRAQLTGKHRLVREGWTVYPLVLVDTFLASAYIETGAFGSARDVIDEARAFADDMRHPYSQAMILDYDGYYRLATGDPDAAVPVLREALDLCSHYELLNLQRSVSAKIAMADTRIGKARSALDRLDAAIDPREELRGGTYVWHWLYLAQAEASLATGDPLAALEQVERTLRLTRQSGERPHQAQGLKLKGDILMAKGACEDADGSYRAALDLARACGMRPLEALAGRALGDCLAQSGRTDEARQATRQSTGLLEALGLPLHPPEAGRALACKTQPRDSE